MNHLHDVVANRLLAFAVSERHVCYLYPGYAYCLGGPAPTAVGATFTVIFNGTCLAATVVVFGMTFA